MQRYGVEDFDAASPAQRVKAFDAYHGGDEAIRVGEEVLFPDGAKREANPLGLLDDGPTDPHLRAKRILRYHEIRLRRAVRDFENERDGMIALAKSHLQSSRTPEPPPAEETVERLKQLRRAVRLRQKAVHEAREHAEGMKPAELTAREEADSANKEATETLLTEIEQIKI